MAPPWGTELGELTSTHTHMLLTQPTLMKLLIRVLLLLLEELIHLAHT